MIFTELDYVCHILNHLILPNSLKKSIKQLTVSQISKYLESSRAPVHELYRPLGFYSAYRSIYIFRYHVSAEQQAASHVLAMTWVAFYHLIRRLKTGVRDFGNIQLLVVSFLG